MPELRTTARAKRHDGSFIYIAWTCLRQVASHLGDGVGLCCSNYVLLRQGRHQARAEFAIRQADARIAALQASKEIRNDVQKTNRAHLPERADRWMRD